MGRRAGVAAGAVALAALAGTAHHLLTRGDTVAAVERQLDQLQVPATLVGQLQSDTCLGHCADVHRFYESTRPAATIKETLSESLERNGYRQVDGFGWSRGKITVYVLEETSQPPPGFPPRPAGGSIVLVEGVS